MAIKDETPFQLLLVIDDKRDLSRARAPDLSLLRLNVVLGKFLQPFCINLCNEQQH